MSLSLSIYVYTQSGIPTQLANISRSAPSGATVNCYPSPTAHLTTTYTWSALSYGCPDGFSFSTRGSNATCVWTSTRPAVDLTWNCLYTIAGGLKTTTGSGGTRTLTSDPATLYITVTQTQQSTITSTTNLAPGGITQTITSTITHAPVAPRENTHARGLKQLGLTAGEVQGELAERDAADADVQVRRDEGLHLQDWLGPGPHRIRPAKEMLINSSSPLFERACSAVDILCPGGQCCPKNNSMCIGTAYCCEGFGCIPFSPSAPFEKAIVPKVLFSTSTSYRLTSVKTTATVTSTTNIYTIVTDVETQTAIWTTSATAAVVFTTITGQPQVIVVNNAGAIVGGVVGGVAGITLISAGIFLLLTRKKSRRGYKPPPTQGQTLLGGAAAFGGNYPESHYSGAGSNYSLGQPNTNAGAEGYNYTRNPPRSGLLGTGGMLAQPYQPLAPNSGAGGYEPYLGDPAFRQQPIQGQQAYDPVPAAPAAAFTTASTSAAMQQRGQYQEYQQRQPQVQNPPTQATQYQQYQPHQPQTQSNLNPNTQPTIRAVGDPSTGAGYPAFIPSISSSTISAQQSHQRLQPPVSTNGAGQQYLALPTRQPSVAPSLTSNYTTYNTPIPSSVEAFFPTDHYGRRGDANPPTGQQHDDPRDRHIPGKSPTFEIHEMVEFPPAGHAPRYF